MIITDYMSSSEFQKKIESNDEVCVLAQALAEEAMGVGYNLSYKTEFIRQRYIELAKDLIQKLDKHDLVIIHKNKNEVKDVNSK